MSGSPTAAPDKGDSYWEEIRSSPPPPPPSSPATAAPAGGPAPSPPEVPPSSPGPAEPTYVPPWERYYSSSRRSVVLTPAGGALIVSAIAMMVGSTGPWVTVSFGPIHISATGTSSAISAAIGINGWLTFTAGVVLVLLFLVKAAMGDRVLRDFSPLVAFIGLGLTIYDMARVAYDVSQTRSTTPFTRFFAGEHVGWGLVLLLIGAIAAMVAAVADARSS